MLGLAEGRSSGTWVDWNFYGHQLVTHVAAAPRAADAGQQVAVRQHNALRLAGAAGRMHEHGGIVGAGAGDQFGLRTVGGEAFGTPGLK